MSSFTKLNKSLGLIALSTAVFLTACSDKKKDIKNVRQFLGGDSQELFSNRQITQDEFIAIVKLKSPALLTTATKQNGVTVVDEEAKKTVDQEHEDAIKALKELSSDIRIVYSYKNVINGLAVLAPIALKDKIASIGSVAFIEGDSNFARPIVNENKDAASNSITEFNSVNFIGADKAHKRGITGKGIKVGIIDTGIDYTHSMFFGAGSIEAYNAINPDQPTSAFPNSKVVGGIDLVGTKYDSGSGDYKKHIPQPDENPIDEQGHGSHVGGTVAGHGDNLLTYSGVAPDADLYALKVFGKDGSTSDSVVIAAFEYAADPNKDGDYKDQLDVVNLSLGSSYGNPKILYTEAIKNISNSGTFVVASAGNSGDRAYIVGSPSVADDAISVAASVDHSLHNWQFSAVKFLFPTQSQQIVEAIESSMTKPISSITELSGALVYAGLADKDFDQELSDKLKGKVAFIDRGRVTFSEKIRRASEAGAIGVVIANNQPGNPFSMGGDGKYEIPAIMISQALGNLIKEEQKTADVVVHFVTPEKIQKKELIDTITDFSSKGPRSFDSVLKPEIAAPGANVISAAFGKGNAGVKFSGTSMAAPHMSGVIALLKQARPDLSSQELKALVMQSSKVIANELGKVYPLSRQGAGRVQVDAALDTKILALEGSISLGETTANNRKTLRKEINLKNISKEDSTVTFTFEGHEALTLGTQAALSLKSGAIEARSLRFTVDAKKLKNNSEELDGNVFVKQGSETLARIPVLLVVNKVSNLKLTEANVLAGSQIEQVGAAVELKIQNDSEIGGQAMAFNLLALDNRKSNPSNEIGRTTACDLQAAGYRIVKKVVDNVEQDVLQVAAKIYEPVSVWNSCELSVQIDKDQDGIADQELGAIVQENLKGVGAPNSDADFFSILLDAKKARELRLDFEKKSASEDKKPTESYADALLSKIPLNVAQHSTVIVAEAPVSLLAKTQSGILSIQIATLLNEQSTTEADDFAGQKEWFQISTRPDSHGFYGMPELTTVSGNASSDLELTKGAGSEKLLLLFPNNTAVQSDLLNDNQLTVPEFKFLN